MSKKWLFFVKLSFIPCLLIRKIIFFLCIICIPQIQAQDSLFCDFILSIQQGQIIQACALLQDYKEECGEDALYNSFLIYLAEYIDSNTLCSLLENDYLKSLACAFIALGEKQKINSRLLQKKSELISRELLNRDCYNIDYLNLWASSITLLKEPPLLDHLMAQRVYQNILTIDPSDCDAWSHMALEAHLAGYVDASSYLYSHYFCHCLGDTSSLMDYGKVLEDQYNVLSALYVNDIYGHCVGYDCTYWQRKAHILCTGYLFSAAYGIASSLVKEDPDNFINWVNYTDAAAGLNYRCEALYGLYQLECWRPGDSETDWARWAVLPAIMSRVLLYGSYYHNDETLTQTYEGIQYYLAVTPNTKYSLGLEAFQTRARPKVILIGGIGLLTGDDDQTTAEVEFPWIGIERLFHPKLEMNVKLGAGRLCIEGIDTWTPTYSLDLDSRQNDQWNFHWYSYYGNYLVSPRASSFQLRRWQNRLEIDFRPRYDLQLLTTWDGRAITDGNKQLEIFVYPRKTFFYLEKWKFMGGFMGDWLSTLFDPQHGYYAPSLYQVYAAQMLIDYRVNLHSVIKVVGALGTQKDNFSTFFGPYAQVTLDCAYDVSLTWKVRLYGDYYFVRQSGGAFDYYKIQGELSYRF